MGYPIMKNKLIRDSIHGYIEIPEIITSTIIDTPIFQRLRQIEQTSMRALYPSAHHDRFVHSIGVYHLGKSAFKGLQNNIFSKNIYTDHRDFWEKYGACFELACLLHDCGHSPMSHSFEYCYLKYSDADDCLSKKNRLLDSMVCFLDDSSSDEYTAKIIEQCNRDITKYFEKPKKIAPHEMVSAILVSEYFGKKPDENSPSIIEKVLSEMLGAELSTLELAEYIIFIQRAIIGLEYSDYESATEQQRTLMSFKNCLISLLNGNFFDVDKLDYIIRDTVEAGTNNISIDIPRILNALTLVEIHQFEKETAVENLELNNSIYFKGCQGKILDKSETSDCECALNLSGVHVKGDFQGTLESKGNSKLITPDSDGILSGRREFQNMTSIDATISTSGKLIGRFSGSVQILGHEKTDKIDGLINSKLSGKITGEIIGYINSDVPHRLTYKIGYLKTAISVIEDTLIARNRLFLWIYAHHKVTYHDYILRQGILRSFLSGADLSMGEIEKKEKANSILQQIMSIDNLFFEKNKSDHYLLCDGDLIHKMKTNYINNKKQNPFAKEWLSRKHMHPVWKSYAEYNSFFSNLSLSQRKIMWNLLFNNTFDIGELSDVSESNTKEYENSVLKELFNDIEYTWIKPAGFKLKEMDISNIYIVLSDNSVKRFKDVITQPKVTEQYVDESFFYLYTSKILDSNEKLQLISYLKKAVKQK